MSRVHLMILKGISSPEVSFIANELLVLSKRQFNNNAYSSFDKPSENTGIGSNRKIA